MACQREKFRHTARVSDQRVHMPQLDGLRAVAMFGVIYHHWLPSSWRFHFPTEAGLFLFFVLSGFLMTQGLLRERESLPVATILKRFHLKRLVRIYPAYYSALAFAAAFGVVEIWNAPQWWLLNAQNFFILGLRYWPPGVSHFWTLAVEQQYYLVWPLVILFTPRKLMLPALILLTLISPLTRLSSAAGGWLSMDLIPWGVIDDFALGSLLALLMHRGVMFPHRIMDAIGLLALACYGYLYISWEMNHAVPYWCHTQQTFLALTFMALISRAACGRSGAASRWLEHPRMVQLGQWSYGIYLFHNLAPFLVGKVFWFLWSPSLDPALSIALRLPLYILATAGLTWACRRWVETPALRWFKR
jgi:peptidoglycan/LPS O-acetylase OafA/YrhL